MLSGDARLWDHGAVWYLVRLSSLGEGFRVFQALAALAALGLGLGMKLGSEGTEFTLGQAGACGMRRLQTF